MRRATFERTPKSLLIGIGVTLLGGALWGVNATVSKILMSDYGADPLWIASIRQLCAGMLFLAAAGATKPKLLTGAVRDVRSYPVYLLGALICVMATQVTYLNAIKWTNSGTATVLQTLNLLFVLAWVCLRGRRLPGKREALGVALAFMGTVLIATGGDLTTLTLPLAGLMWGLGDALATATMSILPVKVMGRYGNFTVNGLMFLISVGRAGYRTDGVHRGRRYLRRLLAVYVRCDADRRDARHDARHQRARVGHHLRRGVDRRRVHSGRSGRFRDDSGHGVPGAVAWAGLGSRRNRPGVCLGATVRLAWCRRLTQR